LLAVIEGTPLRLEDIALDTPTELLAIVDKAMARDLDPRPSAYTMRTIGLVACDRGRRVGDCRGEWR
jgi:hypothetical protein